MMSGVKRLFVIPVGHIENDLMWNVAGISAASKAEPRRPAQWVRVPCLVYLIEHEERGWILYDTGFRPEDPSRVPKQIQEQFPGDLAADEGLAAGLSRLGLKPSDIARIVVSHMHWDHGGGLSLFSGLPAGQNILAGERDFAYGLSVTHRKSGEPFGGGGYFKEHFEIPGIGFDLVDPALGDFELAPGLRIVQLEGHTPQILGLLVRLPKSGTILLPSDAVYMKRNLYPAVSPPSIIYDSLGFQRSAQKILQLVRMYDARIIYPHDPDQMSDVKILPDYYD
jgi:glyoxylase-like metal-dependent hydrolase (beta-lactamase superfamily II)